MKGDIISTWIYIIGGIVIAALMISTVLNIENRIKYKEGREKTNKLLSTLATYIAKCKNTSLKADIFGPVNITSKGNEMCINDMCVKARCKKNVDASFYIDEKTHGLYNISVIVNDTINVRLWLLTS